MSSYLLLCLRIYCLAYLLFKVFLNSLAHANVITIKTPPPRSSFDVSHDYHIKLLSHALTYSAPKQSIEFVQSVPMSQGRAEAELIKGKSLDVYWFGTNTEIEQKLRAIKIPTTRGLIGFRKLLINKDLKSKFDHVTSLDDLKVFIACQGAHWPDTKILTRAGIAVTTSTSYENLFRMTSLGRCDYFPRGYHDAINELQIRKESYPSLMSYQRILLHYPFAVYFFTNKEKSNLANLIESGLIKMANNGEILKLMKSHPLTQSIFPIKSETKSLYLPINNPYIDEVNVENNQYWFTPDDFDINRP
ncbi:MAG: hypothetical protein HWE10_09185 [Gammaproteobacteria bacterium]|nr:hypothetical protein [Gammaproteobacteria bacterium]